ncbi:MAG: hypothetical protein ACRDD8_05240 [Bacteroidales bacterium]
MTIEESKQIAESVWQIIEDSSRYSFNSAHSLAVSYDSLYNAFQKVRLTNEFFETVLAFYSGEFDKSKKDIEKLSRIKEELAHFGLGVGGLRWGLDNSTWIYDAENSAINQSLLAVKGLNQNVATYLAECKDKNFNDFVELFLELNEDSRINMTHWKNLAKINYFCEFGSRGKILYFLTKYDIFYKSQMRKDTLIKNLTERGMNIKASEALVKKYCGSETEKTYGKMDKVGLLKEFWERIPDKELPNEDIIRYEITLLEYVLTKLPVVYGKVVGVSKKNNSFRFHSLRTGVEDWVKLGPGERLPVRDEILIINKIEKKKSGNRTNLFGCGLRPIDLSAKDKF